MAAAAPQAGQGSGFVISDEGEIVTNAHVVTDGQTGGGDINQANEVFVQFPDRNTVEAEVIGFDPFADVALLKVDPEGLDIQPVELGNIEDVEVGEQVAAIGSPFGEEQSLSVGVVSQTDRSIPSLTTFSIDGAIQTDASINPGNSGGPLLDSEANVIGINQQIDTTSGGNQGVGFAVPVDLFERSVDQLREDGQVEYAFIGVTTTALFPQLAEELDAGTDTGVIVAEVPKAARPRRPGFSPPTRRSTSRSSRTSTWAATSSSRSTARRSRRGGPAADHLAQGPGRGGHARNRPRRRGDGGGRDARSAPGHSGRSRRGLGTSRTERRSGAVPRLPRPCFRKSPLASARWPTTRTSSARTRSRRSARWPSRSRASASST